MASSLRSRPSAPIEASTGGRRPPTPLTYRSLDDCGHERPGWGMFSILNNGEALDGSDFKWKRGPLEMNGPIRINAPQPSAIRTIDQMDARSSRRLLLEEEKSLPLKISFYSENPPPFVLGEKDQPCTAMSSWILAGLGSLGQAFIGSLIDKISDDAITKLSEVFGVGANPGDGTDLLKLKTTLTGTKHIIGRVENMWIKDEDTKKQLKELVMELKDTAYDAEDLLDEIQFRVLKKQIEKQGAQSDEASNQSSSSSGLSPWKKMKISVPKFSSRFVGREDYVNRVRENQINLDKITTCIEDLITTLDADEKQMITKILVTTRSKKIAEMVGNPIPLGGLDEASYWKLFKKCAFGSEDAGEFPQLEAIAKKIAGRLKGLPLAARTVGGLLKAQMNEKHWRNIAGSEIWRLPQDEEGLLPVLQLSYRYLPPHLKRCFVFCSLFPEDCRFYEPDLIQLWMAEGYVARDNMTLDAIGSGYFRELVNRSFFQEAPRGSAYVMHDLIHDLAQFISEGEFCRIEDDESKEIPNMTRHLSATLTDGTKLMEFSCYDKLRTLMINYKSHWYGFRVKGSLFLRFERLKNIRVLILQSCGLRELPETIGGSIHLRYLDISRNRYIRRLPKSLCGLYNLRVLDLQGCELQSFPYGMSKLINLKHLNAEDEIISEINDVGKLTSLRGLSSFKVLKDQGREVAQLGSLKQLHGQLRISNLENVESKQEARKANLNNKQYLDALALEWTSDDGSSLDGNELVVSEEVLEGLQPHQALERLMIVGYIGVRSPSWLQAHLLANLMTLGLENCKAWKDLSCIGQLPNLKNLYVGGMPAVKQISHELCTESKFLPNLERLVLIGMVALEELPSLGQLPSLKVLRIERMPAVKKVGYRFFGSRDQDKCFPSLEKLKFRDMPELEEWSWPDGRQLFPCLRILEIVQCPRLKRLPPLPPPLETLEIDEVGLTELPGLWEGIHGGGNCITASLSTLRIRKCPNLRNLVEGLLSHSLPNIRDIEIAECAELVWLPVKEFKELTSLKKLSIRSCPKLLSMTRDGDIDIPLPPSIEELVMFDCGNLGKLLLGCLHNLTSLTRLEIGDCRCIESLPATSLLPLKRLQYLKFWNCGELRSKDELLLNERNKQVEGSSVTELCIDDTALFKLSLLRRILPSVRVLTISNFPRATMSGEEEQLFRSLTALRWLEFKDCKNLQSLPTELHAFPSLCLLTIIGCPKIQALPEKGLPTSLRNLHFEGCHPRLTERLEKHLTKMKSSGRFLALDQSEIHEDKRSSSGYHLKNYLRGLYL
ncbi:hypothetical protein C4D60_Mb01t09380 [Musa balbisiana]|uniref:NB-ARC domain-containing protein n=1 Tax=Musa balbisiana TaxID=52838 RepID=A0A4S8JLA1_MUSBA|nr:hypothetical protein C4D60_Mb01t09380 [Musa balbisiana]